MHGSTTTAAPADTAPQAARHEPGDSGRVLCAYSPRWLSGPTPRYRGLCATWDGDEPTTEHPAARAN